MNLGENIKRLRREHSVTQEELAEYLGVTPQAVSGWECGRNAPDIQLLPLLANIFDTTTDEILGVNIERKKSAIDDIVKNAKDKFNEGYAEEAMTVVRKGLMLYPNSYRLMSELSEYLYCRSYSCGYTEEERKSDLDEATQITDVLIEKCTDSNIKAEAIRTRCMIYNKNNQTEYAAELAMQLPEISRNDILFCIYQGNKLAALYKESLIDGLSDCLYRCRQLSQCVDDSGKPLYTSDEQLAINQKVISCYEILFENGDYNFFAQFLQYAYRSMAEICAEKKNREKTIEYLRKSVKYGIMFYSYPEDAVQTSLLFKGIRYGGWVKSYPGDTSDSVRGLLDDITNERCFDFIREDAELRQIINTLNDVSRNSN